MSHNDTVTGGLTDRLRRHYVKPGQDRPGGVFIPEVGLNSPIRQHRCDAVYVGITATSGQLLVGHEIKVSRADWRRELDNPDKADLWASQCHAWYIVAPSNAVVPPDELPLGSGWGLMVPNPRSINKMTVVVRATPRPEPHQPSWLILRSILARLDTLQAAERQRTRADERRRADEAAAVERSRLTALAERAGAREAEQDKRILDRLEHSLGLDLRGRDVSFRVDPDTVAMAVKIAQHPSLTWRGAIGHTAAELRRAVDQLDSLSELVETFTRDTQIAVDAANSPHGAVDHARSDQSREDLDRAERTEAHQ